jgi:hypothetical protein
MVYKLIVFSNYRIYGCVLYPSPDSDTYWIHIPVLPVFLASAASLICWQHASLLQCHTEHSKNEILGQLTVDQGIN